MSDILAPPFNDGAPMLITASELATVLKISVRSIWRMLSCGKVPVPIRIGGTVRWRLDEVKSWIADGCPPIESRENDRRRK